MPTRIFSCPLTHADCTVVVRLFWNPRRRTRLGIAIERTGVVRVDAPPGTGVAEVRAALQARSAWVARKLSAADAQYQYPSSYVDGAKLIYRGDVLVLRLARGAAEAAETVRILDAKHGTEATRRQGSFGGGPGARTQNLELVAPANRTKQHVWAWYGKQADAVLEAAVAAASARLPWVGAVPAWRHRPMKSRWGSCSSRGSISLNTHLVKLPKALLEYVVVHELCHLREMNHGAGFQRLMDASLADWKQRRKALRAYAGILSEPPPEQLDDLGANPRCPASDSRRVPASCGRLRRAPR